MKRQIPEPIDATPQKRIYWAIIADYTLELGISELVDNAIDSWIRNKKQRGLLVEITLDFHHNTILVADNAGGIREEEISVIVSPGETSNEIGGETIGIFGVGSKRAVVYLSRETVIKTRYQNKKTLLVEISDSWLKTEDWELLIYEEDDPIPEGSTIIEMSKLRDFALTTTEESRLFEHLSVTYARIIQDGGFQLVLNGNSVTPKTFDIWSFPPDFSPHKYTARHSFSLSDEEKEIRYAITAGLAAKGEPGNQEYGVYFYCNKRLVGKAIKEFAVGFSKGKIGSPHPSIMLMRVIVEIEGESDFLPWNSSKSGINYHHPVFTAIQETVVSLGLTFSKVSKHFSSDDGWKKNIFPHSQGDIREIELDLSLPKLRLFLPPIPRRKQKKYTDQLRAENKALAKQKPWIVGLYEAFIVIEVMKKEKLQQGNRISLMLLVNILEIGFKEYLVKESGKEYSDTELSRIYRDRRQVIRELKKNSILKQEEVTLIEHYFDIRNDLMHKRASASISNDDLQNLKQLTENLLRKMFNIRFPDPE
jgi:hypothetical protein